MKTSLRTSARSFGLASMAGSMTAGNPGRTTGLLGTGHRKRPCSSQSPLASAHARRCGCVHRPPDFLVAPRPTQPGARQVATATRERTLTTLHQDRTLHGQVFRNAGLCTGRGSRHLHQGRRLHGHAQADGDAPDPDAGAVAGHQAAQPHHAQSHRHGRRRRLLRTRRPPARRDGRAGVEHVARQSQPARPAQGGHPFIAGHGGGDPALPDFYARYPDIQLELGVSDRPIDILAENVDCVIRGGEITDQSLVARRIGEFYLMSCASPAYLKRHGTPEHPKQLVRRTQADPLFLTARRQALRRDAAQGRRDGGGRGLPPAVGQRLERRRGGGAGRPGHPADAHLPRAAPHQQRRAGAAVQRLVFRGQAHPRGLPAQPPPEQQGARVCRLDRRALCQARPDPAQEHLAGPPHARPGRRRSTRRLRAPLLDASGLPGLSYSRRHRQPTSGAACPA
jgi:hypothetical protein